MAKFTTDLSGVREEDRTELLIWRSEAIESYAVLEQALCKLLASLLGTPIRKASAVFFRIINTRSRNEILSSLFEQRFDTTYFGYWKSLRKFLKILDQTRNRIVHWHMTSELHFRDGPGQTTATFELTPPDFWNFPDDTKPISIYELAAFSQACRFTSISIDMFVAFTDNTAKAEDATKWQAVFDLKFTYPPQEGHPLYRPPQPTESA